MQVIHEIGLDDCHNQARVLQFSLGGVYEYEYMDTYGVNKGDTGRE